MIRKNARQQKGERGRAARTYFLILVCGLLMVAGFFFAGRQHFAWMDYGMRNSKLRKQIEDLEGEKRRLLLARETSLSPTEIKKAAKKFIGIETPTQTTPETASLTKSKPSPESEPAAKAMVVKTVAVTPTSTAAVVSYKKFDKTNKQIARVTSATE